MLFIHTIDKVLSGEKTQTRRIVKPGQYGCLGTPELGYCMVAAENGRFVYQVGKTYAIQPGRGKAAVARMRITDIRREDVREISYEDVCAEGFVGRISFLETWVKMHDKAAQFYCSEQPVMFFTGFYRYYKNRTDKWQTATLDEMLAIIATRPAERYQAWALTFEVVK